MTEFVPRVSRSTGSLLGCGRHGRDDGRTTRSIVQGTREGTCEDGAEGDRSSPIRVGFVSLHDPRDRGSLSGMPHAMFSALAKRHLELVDLGRLDRSSRRIGPAHPIDRAVGRAHGVWERLVGGAAARWRRRPDAMTRRLFARCRRRAAILEAAIDRHRPDVLFGNCMSSPFAFLDREPDRDLPIVYSSDATAEIIASTYPRYTALGPAYAAATDEIERLALRRVRFAALASPATLESAVTTYGLPRERGRVAGFGANLGPRDVDGPSPPIEGPTREALRLTITAADPVRKRLDLAIECVGILRSRGWNASLDVIGPRPDGIGDEAGVRWAGRLDHARPEHVARHARILAASHLCLLPSSGEAYGIAPIESAAFGRPAVVADVGGLPFVVRDGETGRVVPRNADAETLAGAVEEIAAAPSTYRRMASAARARAEGELHWDVWAGAIFDLIRQAVEERRASGSGGLSDRGAAGRS